MSRKRPKRQKRRQNVPKHPHTPDESSGGQSRWWTFKHTAIALAIVFVLMVGIGMGGAIINHFGPPTAQPPSATQGPGGEAGTDAYGRSPGHPHYGHAHPSPSATQGAGGEAGTDAYGRSPGHPHYGHAHP